MSELKRICPFCGGEMIGTIGHPICHYNPDCVIYDESVPQELLDLLADTKNKLDIAIWGLEWIFGYENVPKYVLQHISKVLDEIKNKEEK